MPDIYRAGAMVPDLKGKVEGAVTVVLRRPEEMDALLALCELAGSPPEDRMHAVYRELSTPEFNPKAWLLWKRHLPARVIQEKTQAECRAAEIAVEMLRPYRHGQDGLPDYASATKRIK